MNVHAMKIKNIVTTCDLNAYSLSGEMDVITWMLNKEKEDKLDQSDGLDSYSVHAGRSNINT